MKTNLGKAVITKRKLARKNKESGKKKKKVNEESADLKAVFNLTENNTSETPQCTPVTDSQFSEMNGMEKSPEKSLEMPVEEFPILRKIKTGNKKSSAGKITKKTKTLKKNLKLKLCVEGKKKLKEPKLIHVNVGTEESPELNLEILTEEQSTSAKTPVGKTLQTAAGNITKESKTGMKKREGRLLVGGKKQLQKNRKRQILRKVKQNVSPSTPKKAKKGSLAVSNKINSKKEPVKSMDESVIQTDGQILNSSLPDTEHEQGLMSAEKQHSQFECTVTGDMERKDAPVAATEHTLQELVLTSRMSAEEQHSQFECTMTGDMERKDAPVAATEHTPQELVLTSHERASKKGENVFERKKIIPGTVCKAIVLDITKWFMFIWLELGAHGRIHISQVEDNDNLDSTPFSKFQYKQEIEVVPMVRNLRNEWECNLFQRPENDSAVCCKKEYEVGQKVTAFVTSVTKTRVWMTFGLNVSGVVSQLESSTELENVLCLEKCFKVGQRYTATILYKSKSFYYMLTLLEPEVISVGSVIVAKTADGGHDVGISLHLPCNYKGSVCWTDVRDKYGSRSIYLKKLSLPDFYPCCILSVYHDRKLAIVSLRESRVSKTVPAVIDREINTIYDLHENDEVKGYVIKWFSKQLFVAVGRSVNVCVCQEQEIPRFCQGYGNVVKVRIAKVIPEEAMVFGNLTVHG